MRYRLQRHDGTDCSATMVPITVLRMVPIQRYRQKEVEPDMRFLNLFFRNLMMGENHELKNGFVAPLYPNNPKHPRQKYLLTVKGLAIFNSTK